MPVNAADDLTKYPKTKTFPQETHNVGKLGFNKSVENVLIPNSVTDIEENAFDGSVNLKLVRLGKSVKTIKKNAFFMCSNLKHITLKNNVTTIGESAFAGT